MTSSENDSALALSQIPMPFSLLLRLWDSLFPCSKEEMKRVSCWIQFAPENGLIEKPESVHIVNLVFHIGLFRIAIGH